MTDIVGSGTIYSQWRETVKYNRDKPFLRFIPCDGPTKKYSYNEFDILVKRYAGVLKSYGVKRGDYFAVHLNSCPEYLLIFLAVAHIGAILVPINGLLKECETSYIIKKSNSKYLFTDNSFKEIFNAIALNEDLDLKRIFVAKLSSAANEKLVDFNKALESADEEEFDPRTHSDDTAVILFTSGTTKNPKGTIYTHAATLFGGYFHAQQVGITPTDSFLTSMPPYHMDFQEMALMPTICTGSELIMVEHYSATKFWKQVVENKANFTDTMSFMNRTMLMKEPQPWEKEHCLKQIYFSMGLSDEERDAFEKRFNVRLLNSYGMTETVTAVTCTPLTGDTHWPSVGKVAVGYKLKIVGEDGAELAPGESGEICILGDRGRTLVSGYLNDGEATNSLYDRNGWMHTGDAGYIDKDGWLYFQGRIGDMIKRCGENISALEIECLLTSHEKIADAAVKSESDELRDQKVKAFIQPKDGAYITKEEVTDYCTKYLASFKVPTEIEFVKEFPRTATGKIIKNKL